MMNVLVVDDSLVMRKIIIKAIKSLNCTSIIEAADGDDAIQKMQDTDFDLLLVDWNMPGIKGIDVLKTIRQQGKTTPVIMITTDAGKNRVMDAISAGANNYVIKPFEAEELLKRIQDTLAKCVIA